MQVNVELRGDDNQLIDRFVFKLLPLDLLSRQTILEKDVSGIFQVSTAGFLIAALCTEDRVGRNCNLPQDITTTTTEPSDTITVGKPIISVLVPVLFALVIVSLIAILVCAVLYKKRCTSKSKAPDTTNRSMSFQNNATEVRNVEL